jgi:hypothetical protein
MKKTICLLVGIIILSSCSSLQEIVNNLPSNAAALSQMDIAAGLRQALDQGIKKEVTQLTGRDGFYKNQLVKISLPADLQKVDRSLRKIGLNNIADEGLKLLNRAAEDATKEALPIFVDAVRNMTFNDAENILLGDQRAATSYLENKTKEALYAKFSPVIENSLEKVGATGLWRKAITKYNSIPFIQSVNPDLTDYVTEKALEGVFKMISLEEIEIRTKIGTRSTDMLKRVFALQDR